MTQPDEWEGLREAWRPRGHASSAPDDYDAAGLIARAARASRAMALVALAEVVIVIVAAAGVLAAMRHSANAVERILGLSVVAAIASVWTIRALARRRERDIGATSALEYVALLRGFRQRQIRFVHFSWLVLSLELVFLLTWWVGGIPVHRGQLASPIAFTSMWVPLVTMVAFVAWTMRLRARASAELLVLAQLERRLRDD